MVTYNQKGPSPFEGGQDEIYIECNPTGDDGKVLVPEGEILKMII